MNFSTKYGSGNSKYCYPNSDVLINKQNIRDYNLLEEADSRYTTQRLLELQTNPIEGNFDLDHVKNIHYYIFQDLYYFAGKLREEDIIKGNTHFAKYQYIETSAIKLFEELKEENYLIGTSFNQFSEKASYYMAELNIIHPFREGNGRTIREFIRILALKNGYQIKWNSINQKTLFKASVESVLNLDPLIKCIKGAIKS
ncbi:cell filamentation protein [Halanaerobium congolense]|jgi:cell filamentation protein|uniref:protein adenylyltransferase n=1 Tax=Halanaerobium congolense TaxID=54121 RepID=A0A1I0D1C5_9FIRM|nr:Fic family protein [Halanaerobium congolense]PTX16323.1 cell filamentation protein [Halanaerobium congolense]SDG15426.1 cell filamentation protein [Halanaerobium congolense]SET25389.1 cell filamentation protein [Halanaerobium congolense]SFP75467.1 cell filamentation protein [Halanaerobium congolense]